MHHIFLQILHQNDLKVISDVSLLSRGKRVEPCNTVSTAEPEMTKWGRGPQLAARVGPGGDQGESNGVVFPAQLELHSRAARRLL